MLKKTITYTDYNGQTLTEDFYFNLTKAELVKMELGVEGGLAEQINSIVKAKNVSKIIEIFEMLIDKSYGVKSPDGKRFIKNEDVLNEFKQTEAYSELYMELAQDSNAAADFINGIVPQQLAEEAKKQITNN